VLKQLAVQNGVINGIVTNPNNPLEFVSYSNDGSLIVYNVFFCHDLRWNIVYQPKKPSLLSRLLGRLPGQGTVVSPLAETSEVAPSSLSTLEPHDIDPSVVAAGMVLCQQYRVVGRIGSGGAATVWGAVDTETDGEVALKVYTHETSFLRELKFLGRIRHHRIIHTLATFDQRSSGHPYCVTVFPLGNQSLQDMYSNALIPSPNVVKVIAEVAQ
jgi:hypothetical protein